MNHQTIPPRDLEALSAYIDGQLKPKERARLEARLQEDAALLAALQELRRTRDLVRSAPRLRAPRNFTLTSEMVGLRRASGVRLYPTFRLASVLASLLFVLVTTVDLLGFNGLVTMSSRDAGAPQIVAVEQESAPLEDPAAESLEASKDAPLEASAPAAEMAEETLMMDAPHEGAPLLEAEIRGFEEEAEAPEDLSMASPEGGEPGAVFSEPSMPEKECERVVDERLTPQAEALTEGKTGDEVDAFTAEGADENAAATGANELTAQPEIKAEAETETPTRAPEPTPEPVRSEPGRTSRWPAIRWVEVILGVLALGLGAITLVLRRRG